MAPIVECVLGSAETPVGNDTYVFTRDERGRYVADVHNLKHVAILVGLPAYRELREEAENSTALTTVADVQSVAEPAPASAAPPEPAVVAPTQPITPEPGADVVAAAPGIGGASGSDEGGAGGADDPDVEDLDDEDFDGHAESEEEEAEIAAAAAAASQQYLLGSDILPEVIDIAPEQRLPLADIVNQAFADSGLDLAAWNALAAEDRENRFIATIEALQKAANPPPPATPDDFALINGIGKPSSDKLHAAGILTFQQLAELTAEQLAELDKRIGFKGLSVRGKWNELALAHLTDPK